MPLSSQIGLEELSQFFHLPISAVAKELGVCATVLKKICRRNGIPRWPHRKIKSLDKMIASLQAMSPKSAEDEVRIKQEIASLLSKKRYLITNPNSLIKIKSSSTGTGRGRRKKADSAKQHPCALSGGGELSLLRPGAGALEWWPNLAYWHGPPFTDAELADIPPDSPLGQTLLMKPEPLDQLPTYLPPISSPPTSSTRPLSHLAMPSVPSFSPTHSHFTTVSRVSAKLPDLAGDVESTTMMDSGQGSCKLDALEPNLHPSANPLPFTTQYGIHPLTQSQSHLTSPDWRDGLPSWYLDECSSRLSLDYGLTATAVPTDLHSHTASGQPPVDEGSLGGQPFHPSFSSASSPSEPDGSQSFLVGRADPSILDDLL